jgi:hypothetical protein
MVVSFSTTRLTAMPILTVRHVPLAGDDLRQKIPGGSIALFRAYL